MNSSSTPQSLEAEQMTLGAMLIERDAATLAIEIVGSEDFYRELHRKIFEAIRRLHNKGMPIDCAQVSAELERDGKLAEVGGAEHLAALADSCGDAKQVGHYAGVVKGKSVLRGLVRAAEQIIESATQDDGDNADEIVDRAKRSIFDVNSRETAIPYTHIKPLLMSVYNQIEAQFQHRGAAMGIATGFDELDEITAGLHAGELIVVAARPSQGKTCLCLNIAHHVARKERQSVLIFSTEMSSEQITRHLICSEARINSQDLRRGSVQDGDWHRISNAVNQLYQTPIFVRAGSSLSAEQIEREALQFSLEHGPLGLLVVDYLQLLSLEAKTQGRAHEISAIVQRLKSLAQSLKVPILLLSQVARAAKERPDKRPTLADIADYGTLEEDADVIAFIYCLSPDERQTLAKNLRYNQRILPDVEIAEVTVARQRNGPTGTICLGFQPQYAKFLDLMEKT